MQQLTDRSLIVERIAVVHLIPIAIFLVRHTDLKRTVVVDGYGDQVRCHRLNVCQNRLRRVILSIDDALFDLILHLRSGVYHSVRTHIGILQRMGRSEQHGEILPDVRLGIELDGDRLIFLIHDRNVLGQPADTDLRQFILQAQAIHR